MNQYSRPNEYNPVVAPVDINLLQQSLATKQNQIDKGYTIIQDELDKYTQFDIYRPEDRDYLKRKLDEKVKGINQMSGIDLSDVKSIYKLKSMAGELANDETIVNARMSTARIRKEDQVADAVSSNPKLIDKYNVANHTYYNEAKEAYLNGETNSFNEKFMLDTTKERLQEVFKTLTPKQTQELADNNFTIINNVKKTLQDLKNEAIGLASTDANVQKQLQIEYWYATKYKGLNKTATDILDKDLQNITELQTAYKNQITDLVTKAKDYSDKEGVTDEQKKEAADFYKEELNSLERTKTQIEENLTKLNTLKQKVYTGKDLSKDEDFQNQLQGLFYEDYIENLASPYVISKTDRKPNSGYIAMKGLEQRGFEFQQRMDQNQKFQDDLNDYRKKTLGLKALELGQTTEQIPSPAYPEFPVSNENQTPEEIIKYTDSVVLNNVNSSQEKLKGNVSELALAFIEDSAELSGEQKNNILRLKSGEALKNSKEGAVIKEGGREYKLSKAEVDVAHKVMQTIDGLMKSDIPVIPDNYKKFLPQIERLKDSQIEANYYSKWNPQEDAKYALTPKEYDEYTKLTTDKTQYIPTPGGLAVITSTKIEADKKRKEQLDAKINVRKKERMEKFNKRTTVYGIDIPEEGEDPKSKNPSETAKFSLNHSKSDARPAILRIIQEQGVTKTYNDNKKYAVAGSIQGLDTARQIIITDSDQTDEFEDAVVANSQILHIDDNGRIKVQLRDKDKNPISGGVVYVNASEDPAYKGFLNTSGMGYKPLGGITKDDIIKEQRGAYNGDKLINFSLGGLIPGSGINIPYVIMSDTQSIYFEFTVPTKEGKVRVKTPKAPDTEQLKNKLRLLISDSMKIAKGDEKKAYELIIKNLLESK